MLFKAAIGFVAARCDAFELFELAEEIFDEAAPFVDFGVDVEWFQSLWALGNENASASFVQLGNWNRMPCRRSGHQTPRQQLTARRPSFRNVGPAVGGSAPDCPAHR